MTRLPAEAGVALIEVMVAVVVAALALTVLFQAASNGWRDAQVASWTEGAVARAHSYPAELGQTRPITPGEQSAADGNYHYHLWVTQTGSFEDITLYALKISVSWRESGQTRNVTFETKRLAAQGDDR